MIARYKKDLANVVGDARLYALDSPFMGADHIAVSVINQPRWNQVVTQVLPSTEEGASWRGLDGSLSMVLDIPPGDGGPLSHDAALASLGYEADYTPWPEPEPTFKMIRALRVLSLTDPAGNILDLAEGQEIGLPIPVADNLIAQGAAEAAGEG